MQKLGVSEEEIKRICSEEPKAKAQIDKDILRITEEYNRRKKKGISLRNLHLYLNLLNILRYTTTHDKIPLSADDVCRGLTSSIRKYTTKKDVDMALDDMVKMGLLESYSDDAAMFLTQPKDLQKWRSVKEISGKAKRSPEELINEAKKDTSLILSKKKFYTLAHSNKFKRM
ncbi:MAG: hypothetical protein L6408_04300 [Nanoarchaeota archaeon]|nr:hypothetical protein [Nanoarchaeota archaeon]